ncbi:MAG: AAA family ATPase [Myxococcota bacterium]
MQKIRLKYADRDTAIIEAERQADQTADNYLKWLVPAEEILRAGFIDRPAESRIDSTYRQLDQHLLETRQALATALDRVAAPPEELEAVGEDPLKELPIELDQTEVRQLREELRQRRDKLLARADRLRWKVAQQNVEAMQALNERRLRLLPYLSAELRAELKGFGTTGVRQARHELSQVWLLLRYHLYATGRFFREVRRTGETGDSVIVAAFTFLKWLFPIGLFIWWRRRAEDTIAAWQTAAEDAATKARQPKGISRAERVIAFVRRVRRPVEWLLLSRSVFALLPKGATELLELQLLSTVLDWTLGGWFVVNAIDALLSDERRDRRTALQTAHLRWRTLRLLGRAVVAFGLLLSLTDSLVGEGTIYQWMSLLMWLTAVPIALAVVRWWRHVIFHFVGLQRKKGPVLKWVASAEEGWTAFAAAVVGGGYLLGQSAFKVVRSQLGGLDVVKRVLAYWFRREISRQADKRGDKDEGALLDDSTYAALSPEHKSDELVASVADEQLEDVIRRIHREGGGVYAIVGERGAGKSTLLERIRDRTEESKLLRCTPDGRAGFRPVLTEALGLSPEASPETIVECLNGWSGQSALLVDDTHFFVRPVVDGLHEIDLLLSLARRSSLKCTWVLSFDSVIWQLMRRAREVRPLFDDIIELRPWSEEGIVRLLASRSEAAEVDADFGPLVTELPEDADEYDEEDAMARAQRGYYRLLWDYSLGNPAVSLHFWRASLREGQGGRHLVRLFDPPSTDDLERLPDSTVFVLRAIVQLERASSDDVVEATMLPAAQVDDALRYALARRYIEEVDGRIRIRWTWFRTITRFLARRHLLSGPYQS